MPDDFDFSQKRSRPSAAAVSFPLLTYLLCAACVLVTAAYLSSDNVAMRGTVWYRVGHFGLANADDVWNGHYLGLFSTTLIHGSFIHILFNMLWLLQLGKILEETLHPALYALFIVFAAAAGSCVQLLVSGETGIGFSGVVYAMFGLMWAGRGAFTAWRGVATRQNLNYFLMWGAFCVVATYAHWMQIANGAHAGGLLFGLCVGYIFVAPRRRMEWVAPLVLLVALCGMALVWVPWSGAWNWWKGGQELHRGRYEASIRHYARSLAQGEEASGLWHNIAIDYAHISKRERERGNAAGEVEASTRAADALQKEKAAEAAERGSPADAQGDTKDNAPPGSTTLPYHQVNPGDAKATR